MWNELNWTIFKKEFSSVQLMNFFFKFFMLEKLILKITTFLKFYFFTFLIFEAQNENFEKFRSSANWTELLFSSVQMSKKVQFSSVDQKWVFWKVQFSSPKKFFWKSSVQFSCPKSSVQLAELLNFFEIFISCFKNLKT